MHHFWYIIIYNSIHHALLSTGLFTSLTYAFIGRSLYREEFKNWNFSKPTFNSLISQWLTQSSPLLIDKGDGAGSKWWRMVKKKPILESRAVYIEIISVLSWRHNSP